MPPLNLKRNLSVVAFEKGTMMMIQFITTLLLARSLTPEDFGLVAMLAIFVALGNMLVDAGFGGSLIYFTDVDERDYSSVFWLNLGISLLLYGLLCLTAHPIAGFYNEPILANLISVLSLAIVLNALGLVQYCKLYNGLQFATVARIKIASVVVSSLTAILLAYKGAGVWALIIQQVTTYLCQTILLICSNHFIPKFYFSWQMLRRHWLFGKGLFASSLVNIAYDNIYLQITGKIFPLTTTGYFSQAKRLNDIPADFFNQTFNAALFPLFSKIQDNSEFQKRYYHSFRWFAAIIILAFAIVFIKATPIVDLALGEKWHESAWILRWLALGGIFYIFEVITRNAFKSRGLSERIFRIDLTKRIISILIVILAITLWSIQGLVAAYVFNYIMGYTINQFFLTRYLKVKK